MDHQVRAQKPGELLAREAQLGWKIAEVAALRVALEPDIVAMIGNRIIDNSGVALASLQRRAVTAARAMALAHPRDAGATVMGVAGERRVHCEWAAWANGTAVRELDYHDTYLAAEYAHPADNIPPLVAVAQQCRRGGVDLLQGIATAYEIHVALARGICLHRHNIDHVAHLGVSVAAGLGALLEVPPEIIYQAVQQALHTTCATRQSRKGEISSWKAFAPAFASKVAIEAMDRAMRGEGGPSPIYEGTDGVIASLLGGLNAVYQVSLPEPGEPRRAILSTFTKQHSAEYQAQAVIDLAFRLGAQLNERIAADWGQIDSVVLETSHHTHRVIGSGSGDSEKLDPRASRETLDHSIAYIIAVALQDQRWHHVDSYLPERAGRPDTVALWRKVTTIEDPSWTERYHASDPRERAFGGRLVITLRDGGELAGELAVANAHPAGSRPFRRHDYREKYHAVVDGLVEPAETARFFDLVERLPELTTDEVGQLTVTVANEASLPTGAKGIF